MPLIKIGESYYNERKNDVFLIQGNATRDGEMIQAGGIAWTGKRRRAYYVSPEEMKNRWAYYF